MDIWHVTVFSRGNPYDEDCADLDAAKQWAEEKLRERGHAGPVRWERTGDDLYTGSVVDEGPNATVTIQRRA